MSKKPQADPAKTLIPQPVERIVEEQSFMEILTFEESWTEEECRTIIGFLRDGEGYRVLEGIDEEEMFVFERILQLVQTANDNVFTFEVDHICGCAVIEYTGEDSILEMQSSIGPGVTGNRKLVLLVNLNKYYVGGQVHILTSPDDVDYAFRSTAVFPAFMPYNQKEVTEGTKYVLAAWVGGTRRFK